MLKNSQGEKYKGKQANLIGGKNVNLMTWTPAEEEEFKNSKDGVKYRGGGVIIPPDPQKWIISN